MALYGSGRVSLHLKRRLYWVINRTMYHILTGLIRLISKSSALLCPPDLYSLCRKLIGLHDLLHVFLDIVRSVARRRLVPRRMTVRVGGLRPCTDPLPNWLFRILEPDPMAVRILWSSASTLYRGSLLSFVLCSGSHDVSWRL